MPENPKSLLDSTINVARRLEQAASQAGSREALHIVGHGLLVRSRRLAQSIRRLGPRHAYEAGILLRSMIEIKINYAWIRLRHRNSRARRFVRFWPIERLKLLEMFAPEMPQDEVAQKRRTFIHERHRARHLFRTRDKKGKLHWAKSWASAPSVEQRLKEVAATEQPDNPDFFLYTLYASLSAAVHGSPGSVEQMLHVVDGQLVAKVQPETDPTRHFFGALITLTYMIEAVAEDSELEAALRPQLQAHSARVRALASQRKQSRPTG